MDRKTGIWCGIHWARTCERTGDCLSFLSGNPQVVLAIARVIVAGVVVAGRWRSSE